MARHFVDFWNRVAASAAAGDAAKIHEATGSSVCHHINLCHSTLRTVMWDTEICETSVGDLVGKIGMNAWLNSTGA